MKYFILNILFSTLVLSQTSFINNLSQFNNINITDDPYPQNEPTVKISRKQAGIVVAAWRDFRTGVNPPLRRIGFSRSTNSGLTWSAVQLLPTFDNFFNLSSDPAICTDLNGNFYISTISFDTNRTKHTVIVFKSSDNGISFEQKFNIAPYPDSLYFDDKDYIACDLSSSSPFKNNLYVVWSSDKTGMTLVRSTNSGVSWSTRINISSLAGGVGLVPECGPDGELYVIYNGYIPSNPLGIYISKSINGGLNFSAPKLINPISDGGFVIRLPSIAVDLSSGYRNGYIYAVWSDDIIPGPQEDEDVFFSFSSDGGVSWLVPPKRVNDDIQYNKKRQYWPWISVDEMGRIFIIYFDGRNTLNANIVETFLAYSTNGGENFSNINISSAQNPITYINPEIRFGEYINIDSWNDMVIPVWTDGRAGGINQEIFTANVSDSLLGINLIGNHMPNGFLLYQNYPNPFNNRTKIRFSIPIKSDIEFNIYNTLGQVIESYIYLNLFPGEHDIVWNAVDNPSGVYFYTLSSVDFRDTKKMLYIK